MTAPLALLLLGPTASGKSALSLALARRHPVEIISIDSALVYRGMDIGSAKPTPEERSVCPHHLIDVREIDEPYSAADFLTDTAKLVPEIRARGRVPLIVGGTMLYAKALREGLNDLPTTTPEVRSEVLEEGERLGWPAMWEKLREIDPETAARLQPADRQRIGRAIEVWRMTGKTLSSFHAKAAEPLFPMLSVGLLPPDRKLLHRRIEERFDAMLDAGFLAEVRDLMKSPRFDREIPAMRAVGYRQAIDYLSGDCGFDEFRLAGIAATRQLAKRQMTWMRSMPDLTLLDPDDPVTLPTLDGMVETLEMGLGK